MDHCQDISNLNTTKPVSVSRHIEAQLAWPSVSLLESPSTQHSTTTENRPRCTLHRCLGPPSSHTEVGNGPHHWPLSVTPTCYVTRVITLSCLTLVILHAFPGLGNNRRYHSNGNLGPGIFIEQLFNFSCPVIPCHTITLSLLCICLQINKLGLETSFPVLRRHQTQCWRASVSNLQSH